MIAFAITCLHTKWQAASKAFADTALPSTITDHLLTTGSLIAAFDNLFLILFSRRPPLLGICGNPSDTLVILSLFPTVFQMDLCCQTVFLVGPTVLWAQRWAQIIESGPRSVRPSDRSGVIHTVTPRHVQHCKHCA